jgi:DNA repair exonuclease SbcCD ATPase subunit
MITHIFHISDIHILDKNYNNIKNSWNLLVNDIILFPNYKTNVLLVITGDIFEFKTYLNSDDVHIFYELIMQLETNQIRTIIIPGNHDYNINAKCSQDNISILLGNSINNIKWNYINCYSKSGVYPFENILFHIFSPIDKIIPQFPSKSSKNKINIALLHEPIISAQYDNNESIFNGRFKLDQFTKYDFVMLGDIHKPQFLAPNIAYAGSFVQKNRGEGLNHGYILWDLNSKMGRHIWIPLQEIALKIVAKDNEFVAPLPNITAKINYLAFIYQNCSADWLQNSSNLIRDKYNHPISQIIRHEPSSKKINITDKLEMDITNFSHSNLIIKKLKESKTDDNMIQRVLDYHNTFLQNRQIYPTVKYHIRYLSWSNVFCYGPDNHINFEELNGLVGLCGRNKIGKSSVIDILLRILFNECERGYKDDIINKYAKSAYIKCCFKIMDDEYIVEQSWQKYSSATTFHLYRNGEDITKDSIVKTYKYIREDLGLGNYKDFVNLTTALQNRQFIIDLDKKDIYSLLCKLLDIDTMRDIEEHVKKERDFLRRDKKNKLKELDALGTQDNREKMWNNEIQQIDERNAEELFKKNINEKLLNECRDKICYLNRQIQEVDLSSDWKPYECKSIELPYSNEQYLEYKNQLQQFRVEFAIIKEKLSQFNKMKIKQIKEDAEIHLWNKLFTYFQVSNYDELQSIENNPLYLSLINLNNNKLWTIEKFKTSYNYDDLIQFPECNENIDILYRQLISCTQNQIIDANHPEEPIELLQQQLNDYQDANKNLSIYKAQRNIIREILENIKELNQSINLTKIDDYLNNIYSQYQEKYNIAKQAKKIDISYIEESIDLWNKYNEIINNNNIIKQNTIIEEKIKEYNLYMDIKHDLIQYEHIKENNNIKEAQFLLNELSNIKYLEDYNNLKKIALNIKEKMENIKEYINEFDMAKEQLQDYLDYDTNLNKYKQKQLNNTFEIEINELKVKEMEYLENLKDIEQKLIEYSRSIDNIKQLSIRNDEIKNKIINIDDTLNLYETYYGCINYKTGIPSNILRQVCIVLSDKCNEILNNITDFNVEFEFKEEIKIFTISKDGNLRLPASLGSGFQKFLLDMIMRIVLTRISNISNPNILFVDEGFGCLDKENFINVCSCLIKMKDNFDAMIIITHIPELQTYMNQILSVSNNDGFSKLQFGNLTIDDIDLFENINLRIIKKTIEENNKIKNPEIIIEDNGIWSQHSNELCIKLNTNENELIDSIFKYMIPSINNIYICKPCQKEFKKLEQAKAHIKTKTYKNKHFNYLKN